LVDLATADCIFYETSLKQTESQLERLRKVNQLVIDELLNEFSDHRIPATNEAPLPTLAFFWASFWAAKVD
jgi:hypothetical protein